MLLIVSLNQEAGEKLQARTSIGFRAQKANQGVKAREGVEKSEGL